MAWTHYIDEHLADVTSVTLSGLCLCNIPSHIKLIIYWFMYQ